MTDSQFPTLTEFAKLFEDGNPGATWRRALTDAEIQAIHTALVATPFDPKPLILSGATKITWEAEGIRNRITDDDGVIVWEMAIKDG